MALVLLGRGSLHPLTTWGENPGVRAYPEAARPCKLPRPKIARAIQKSFYYVETMKFTILGLDQQFSPNNKEFFFHIYLQKNFCSFSFLRLEFSFGILFTQFGNFSKSSCQHTVGFWNPSILSEITLIYIGKKHDMYCVLFGLLLLRHTGEPIN